jgi:glycosyltransferase involved in cell wall biosynthesis
VHPPLDTRVFYRQARSTAAAGYDTLLIAPGAPVGVVEGVRFRSLPTWGGRAGRPLRWPILLWKALRARGDLYHFHDPELLPWGLLLHWLTRKPVVYDSHEYLKEDILGKAWLPPRLRRPVATFASRVERFCARRLSAVVAVTDDMRDRFLTVQPRTVTVRNLPPAPDLPASIEREPHVAYAGLLNAERGLDILHETARLVRERVPAAEFRILGTVEWDGAPAAERARTPAEWAALGVRFLGTVPPGEVPAIINRASVGWLPRSPAYENNLLAWPNKLVEYMVVGLPVVASDLPLQARVVQENDCGRVVEPLSPAAHAAAISDLLTNEDEARRLGENGRKAARENFTWEAEARRLHTLYTELGAIPPAHVDPRT